ncbi:hypothetical protein [Luteimonas deserti]|uniref:Uncharacterized protein n=1 Tax=Luteimonas deserti TaxID=2752306 RepID=A0A7Z0QRL8_9GAMM|nr:hypothetical protein [Luteimonas deserti]NYZ61750.1 hypothetical protein [Luteimonas deserti]
MDKDFALSCFGWATMAAPYLLLVAANDFRSGKGTLLRASVAVAAGWLLAVAHVVISQELFAASASPEELLKLYDRDGAPRAFVAVVGWVPAAIIVCIAWPLHSWLARRRRRGA